MNWNSFSSTNKKKQFFFERRRDLFRYNWTFLFDIEFCVIQNFIFIFNFVEILLYIF
jgi:hypothetical protein